MKTTTLLPLLALGAFCASGIAAPPKAGPKAGDLKGLPKTAIPANSYGVFSYEDAAKEAAKKKKALAFMVTDERADDPAVKSAGIKLFWALADDAIVTVLRASTAGEWKRLPENVTAVLNSPDLGKGYPKLVVANDDASVLLAGMNSSTIIDIDEKALDKFGKELKKINTAGTPSADYPPPNPAGAAKPAASATPPGTTVKPAEKPDAPPGTPAKPGAATPPAPATAPATAPAGPVAIKNAQPEAWTNSEGKAIQAALVEVNGEAIVFEMGGSKVPYELSKLSEASRKRVAELLAASLK
jgi:hypothetical protein